MKQYDQQQAAFSRSRNTGPGLGHPGPPSAPQPGTGRGVRSGPGGLWLLLAPLACCGGPLLITGLAAAGALAWGGLGLALAVALAGAVLLIRRRRRACPAPELTDLPE